MPSVLVVIPARYASSRFPGKALALVAGTPLVVHALRTASEASRVTRVVVATDDERIAEVARGAGAEVAMTDPALPTGSDRVWAAVAGQEADVIVNLQVDEPLLPGSVLDALVDRLLADPTCDVVTPVVSVPRDDAGSPDVVTVAIDDDGTARYFSRSVIPAGADPVWRHIGVYAYRRQALGRYVAASPSVLERVERLEQLRALGLGLRIGAVAVETARGLHAVDRPDDVAVVERLLAGGTATGPGAGAAVRLLVLDVDGVLTDGRISYLGDLGQLVSFDVKDGEGIKLLRRAGVEVALVTARDSAALRLRAAELGIDHLHTLVTDKAQLVAELAAVMGVSLAQVGFVGDDVGDLAAMAACGFSAAPADATAAAQAVATVVLAHRGGRGAVREVVDLLLAARRSPPPAAGQATTGVPAPAGPPSAP